MAVTVADVIQSLRDAHPEFGPDWLPDAVFVRFLSRYQQRLLGKIAPIKPDALVAVQTVTLPLADFAAGAPLEPHLLIHGGTVHFQNANRWPEPLQFVGFDRRLERPFPGYGAYVDGATLHLLGTEEDWNEVARIEIRYFPEPAPLAALTDPLTLPKQPLDVCVAACADFAARRAPLSSVSPAERAQFVAEFQEAEERYIDEVTGRRKVTVGQTREDW